MSGVTAVVVTFDSEAVIDGCLDALAAHAPDVAVVVVDNGSTDRTRQLVAARGPHVRLVESPRNGGYAAGINLGAGHAAPGDDLLVLNPDARVRAGAVEGLSTALAAAGTGIAVPRLVHPDGSTALSQRRTPTVLRALGEAVLGGERAGRVDALGEIVVGPARYAAPSVVAWASGAAMLVDRRCHEALGGWDESFFLYAEETDLCLRVADRGWLTRYTPDAVVEHIGGHGERTPWRELMLVNKAVLFRRRHGPVRSVAYRGALALHEALRAWRGPYQRAALRRLLGGRSRLVLPTVNPDRRLERPCGQVWGDQRPGLQDALPRDVRGSQRQGGPGATVSAGGDEGGDDVQPEEGDQHAVDQDQRPGPDRRGQRATDAQEADGDGERRRRQVQRGLPRRRRASAEQWLHVPAGEVDPPGLPAQPLTTRRAQLATALGAHPRRVAVDRHDAAEHEVDAVAGVLGAPVARERVALHDVATHDHARALQAHGHAEPVPPTRQGDALHRRSDDRGVGHHPASGERFAAGLRRGRAGLQGGIAGVEEAVVDDRVGVDRDERIPGPAGGEAQPVVDRRALPRWGVRRALEHLGARRHRLGGGAVRAAVGDDEDDVARPALGHERGDGAGDHRLLVAGGNDHEQPPTSPVAGGAPTRQERRRGERRQVHGGEDAGRGDGAGSRAEREPGDPTDGHAGTQSV